MSNQLDALTDAQLSEVFAVEVAGWEIAHGQHPIFGEFAYKADESEYGYTLLCFATSADAVLPFIFFCGWAEFVQTDMLNGNAITGYRKWRVRVKIRGAYIEGRSFTLARAVCIALIMAKRAEKEAAK